MAATLAVSFAMAHTSGLLSSLFGGGSASSCPSPPSPPRPRGVLLAYTWGAGPSSCSPYFMRSWIALPPTARSNTDLVILWEGKEQPCAGEPAGADAWYLKVPPDVLAALKATKLNPAAYRMRAFVWWLNLPESVAKAYGYVGVLDTDMIFQEDIFDRLHEYGRSLLQAASESSDVLHLVSENAAERNDGYTAKRLRLYPACNRPLLNYLANASLLTLLTGTGSSSLPSSTSAAPGGNERDAAIVERLQGRVEKLRTELADLRSQLGAAPGRRLRSRRPSPSSAASSALNDTLPPAVGRFWERFGATHRLNFGSMFGSRDAMIRLCEQVVDVLVGPMSGCWDQGMLNVLVWTGLVAAARPSTRVVVWDCFDGPVKTLDVGALRDSRGRFLNEAGALYPIVHQFRPTRQSKFVAELGRVFPPRATNGSSDAAYHRSAAWQVELFPRPLQRVPFIWDDRRRMEKLSALQKSSGLPNPADEARPLPPALPACASASDKFKPAAQRDEKGRVVGAAWAGMAADGFVVGAPAK